MLSLVIVVVPVEWDYRHDDFGLVSAIQRWLGYNEQNKFVGEERAEIHFSMRVAGDGNRELFPLAFSSGRCGVT